jgi:hypothetical protein
MDFEDKGLRYRENHLPFVQKTAATYAASEALTCRLHAVTAVAHNTVLPQIIAFICSVNAFISELFSA